jgi:hypothetical protein
MAVAMTFRHKRWWLKVHRRIGIGALTIMTAGCAVAILMVSVSGQPHFGSPHTWFGGLTLSSAVLTLMLGLFLFSFLKRAITFRRIHRWLGRLAVIMIMVTIISGLLLVGIL